MSADAQRPWPREEIVAALREALEIVEELEPPEDLRLQTFQSALLGVTSRAQPAVTAPGHVILSRQLGGPPGG